jgi:hypothetical protein
MTASPDHGGERGVLDAESQTWSADVQALHGWPPPARPRWVPPRLPQFSLLSFLFIHFINLEQGR